jgi:hypothetical protein
VTRLGLWPALPDHPPELAPPFLRPAGRRTVWPKEAVQPGAGGVEKGLLLLRTIMDELPAVSADHAVEKPVHRFGRDLFAAISWLQAMIGSPRAALGIFRLPALRHAAHGLPPLRRRGGRGSAVGRRQTLLVQNVMLFLACCARRLSWKETAQAFRTSWDNVFDASNMSSSGGKLHNHIQYAVIRRIIKDISDT